MNHDPAPSRPGLPPDPGPTPVVLAAGLSSRMGAANKLVMDVRGEPVVRHVVRALVEGCGGEAEVVVVVGHQAERVAAALAGTKVRLVENPRYREGMGTSVAAGVAATTGGVLLCVGDLPDLPADAVRRVLERYLEADRPSVVVPTHRGAPGHPVAFRPQFREALLALEGPAGARSVISSAGAGVIRIDVAHAGVLADLDMPSDPRLSPRG